ncbi:MAG: sodium-dependent bicarbonate transport family permease [Melioribacteraceae bacterium]
MIEIFNSSLENFRTPVILFFILGFVASVLKSDLKIPDSIAKILSIYLMIALGFKGGVEISKNGSDLNLFLSIFLSLFIGLVIPIIVFFIIKKLLKNDITNAGAIAAHYGSVSVVTFITAVTFLERSSVHYEGFMVGMMALMESPAIFISLLLVRYFQKTTKNEFKIKEIVKESLFNGSIVLLFGSLFIGIVSGEKGMALTKPFFVDPFQGVLTLFLLEMGMLAGRRIEEFSKMGIKLSAAAILIPLMNGTLASLLAVLIGFDTGTATLFAVLSASSSYIAAPAAVRMALPEANPSIYLTMSLAVTFPFNIIFGIPIYFIISEMLIRIIR